MCMSVHALSCVHLLGFGLDLGNSLDQRGESARALIHWSQSFPKKADGLYLKTRHKLLVASCLLSHLLPIVKNICSAATCQVIIM